MNTTHVPPPFRRPCDVAVIGGSAAGLAAALMLARSRRSVIVIDAGEPRNAPADHMHGYLGHEGLPPSQFLAIGREEVRSYGVQILAGRVNDVTLEGDGRFSVAVAGGEIVARRVVVATGLVDELPDIDGVAEQWGRGVIHCPYCHGYEVRDRRIVVIATSPLNLHQAMLFRQLSDDVTVVLHDGVTLDDPRIDGLAARGVRFVDARVTAVEADADGALSGVRLDDGSTLAADAATVVSRVGIRTEPLASLGLEPVDHPSGMGVVLETDDRGATAVDGVYAAGNVTDPSHQVLHAAGNGSRVGAMINLDLADEDTRMVASSDDTALASYWDARYEDQIWSGNPNGTLVDEAADLESGRALDVGCGEGADAIWLAQKGWQVTAVDVSQVALDRGAAAASERGVGGIEWVCADLAERAPERSAYDLVSLQYSALPREADNRTANAMLDAVAPGGTLLIVGHEFPDEHHADGHEDDHGVRPFDPRAFVQPDAVVGLLGDQWEIVTHDVRDRPGGHTHASHHVRDVVLRARRRPTLS